MNLAVLAATLVDVVDFFPVTFLYGVSKFLFSALALAFVLSLLASFVVAMTVIPLFCSKYLKSVPHGGGHAHETGGGPWVSSRVCSTAVSSSYSIIMSSRSGGR